MKEINKEVHLLGVLREARAVHKQRLQPFLRDLSLTEDQWRVLKSLNKFNLLPDNGLDAKSIAQKSGLVASSLTGVLSRMERDGLITRTKSLNDGRAVVIKSTELGKNKLARFSNIVQEYYSALEISLGKEKMKILYDILEELIELGESPSKEMISVLLKAEN